MDYERFKLFVTEVVDELPSYTYRYDGDSGDGFVIEDDVIVQSHISGGAEGGNCWGAEAQYFTNATPPQDFVPLDKILTEAKPNISYLEYKNIEKLIVEGSYGYSEYYGNHIRGITFSLDIKKLYAALFGNEQEE